MHRSVPIEKRYHLPLTHAEVSLVRRSRHCNGAGLAKAICYSNLCYPLQQLAECLCLGCVE